MRRICTRPDHCCAMPALNRSHHFVHASAFSVAGPVSLLCFVYSLDFPPFGLEHFSLISPVSLQRFRYSGSLRGRLHRCAMENCSARIDPHTVFALSPCAISLKNALARSKLDDALPVTAERTSATANAIVFTSTSMPPACSNRRNATGKPSLSTL